MVRQLQVVFDNIAHLHPLAVDTTRRNGPQATKNPINAKRNKKSAEEVEIVDVCRTRGHLTAHGAGEADHIDHNARDIRSVSAPIEAFGIVVWSRRPTVVKCAYLKVTPADGIIVADHHSRNGRQKDRVRGQICRELVAAREQRVRTHGQTDSRANVPAAADVDEARQQRCQVGAGRDGVGSNVGAELCEGKSKRNNKDAEALGRATVGNKVVEHVKGVPDGIAVNDLGRGADKDADEAGEAKADGNGKELREECITRLAREPGKVWVVDNQGGKVGDAAHDALYNGPAKSRACERRALSYNGTSAACSHKRPDKERNTGTGYEIGLGREQMANLVNGKPEGRQRAQPEDEKGGVVSCGGTRRRGKSVVDGRAVLGCQQRSSKMGEDT